MKILSHNFSNALYYIMEGWRQVFTRCGHEWRWIQPNEPILEVFKEYKPDMFIGTTYDANRALLKALVANPETKVIMKANNWGPSDADIDPQEFPIGIASASEITFLEELKSKTGKPDLVFNFYHENRYNYTMSHWQNILGIDLIEGLPAADIFSYKQVQPKPELECDIAFVGGYWAYKARNLDKYLLPLCYPIGKYNIKIFGNQPWPVPQYLGNASNDTVESLFSSATVCPNISEPHANKFGFEVNERIFKLAAMKAFCINDPIASLTEDIFQNNELLIAEDPEQFQDLIHMFVNNPQLRKPYVDACYKTVMKAHTYCHRVAKLWQKLGNEEESKKSLDLLEQNNVRF